MSAIVCCTSSNLDISQRMHIETFPLCSGMKDLQTPHANVDSKNSMKATFHWKTNTGKDGQWPRILTFCFKWSRLILFYQQGKLQQRLAVVQTRLPDTFANLDLSESLVGGYPILWPRITNRCVWKCVPTSCPFGHKKTSLTELWLGMKSGSCTSTKWGRNNGCNMTKTRCQLQSRTCTPKRSGLVYGGTILE